MNSDCGAGRTEEISLETELTKKVRFWLPLKAEPTGLAVKREMPDAKDRACVGTWTVQVWVVSATSKFAWGLGWL